MDITTIRIAFTLMSLITFVGIWIWAWSRRHEKSFDEAANLPFEGE